MITTVLLNFSCLDSQKAIDDFLKLTQGLHDSCITGFYVSNQMYVNSEGDMIFPMENFPGSSNLTIFLQSQFLNGTTIEFKMTDIEYLKFQGVSVNNDGIISDAQLTLCEAKKILLICNPDLVNFLEVRARAAFWRLRHDLIDSLIF